MSDDLCTTGQTFRERGDRAVLAGVVAAGFLLTLGLLLLLLVRMGITRMAADEMPGRASAAVAPGDASAFILDALLLPALDPHAMPLRWIDPRAAMGCGPESRINVEREPLRPGALVPATPFVLDWDSHGCHPFGDGGPRFDGRVRLTVYREDWGFSAMAEPAAMRVTMGDGRIVHVRRGGAATETAVSMKDSTRSVQR
jgi:hypothetical protein